MGSLAVLLAAVGMYSVMAYSVVQRTREIGIRIALGAKPADVLALVVRRGLALASVGLLVGVCLTLGLSRFLASVSFTGLSMGGGEKLLGGSATNPTIYLAAAAFLCAVAALAAYIPARWAAKVEPMIALRSE
jgi:ABC-type antimicrobial peptide transport system permease subunit